MTTINFTNGTIIPASWLNDVDQAVYEDMGGPGGLASTASGKGASLVGSNDAGGYYTATNVEGQLQEIGKQQTFVNLYRFFSSAQIADYEARTAQSNFAGALDLTTAIQTAIYTTYAAGQNLYCPAGAAKVTGLELPTNTASYEDRGDAWTMTGQGAAQTFIDTTNKGTVFVSQTDTPVLRYHTRRTPPTSGANYVIQHIRFEQRNAAATNPVVLLDDLCEYADFHHNQILQFGVGDGLKVSYQIKGEIHHNFVMYGGYFSSTRSAAGIGINIPTGGNAGLLTVRKNTCRAFFRQLVLGDGTNNPSGTLLDQNEASDCTHGTWIRAGVSTCTVNKPYFEGISGTCVLDEGTSTVVQDGQFYFGFAVGIDGTAFTYGNTYVRNYLETSGAITGGGTGGILIKVRSDGPKKTVRDNTLVFSTSGGTVTNVIGLQIDGGTGSAARIDHSNTYNPRGPWVGGAGTVKILDGTTASNAGGLVGFGTGNNGNAEFPMLSQGAVSFLIGPSALTQANVAANVLTIPQGSFFTVSATAAVTVNSFDDGANNGRLIIFRTTTANMTFADTAFNLLAGPFTGPGVIGFVTERIGASTFAYELFRAVH